MKLENIKNIILAALVLILIAVVLTFNTSILSLEWFEILILLGLISYFLYKSKILEKKDLGLVLTAFLIISIASSFYLSPSSQMARSPNAVLSQNWWEALNWIKNNTAECATVATYWDPGHFITSIANRPVIYDGASQGNTRTLQTNQTAEKDGLELIEYEKGIVQIELKTANNITKARMKDVAISLFTDNESLAIELLKAYKKTGCNEMYFIASSDLISKSQWWTYFATWSPTKTGTCPTLTDPKGDCYFYSIVSLSNAKPQPAQNAVVYTYTLGQNQAFLLYEINNTMKPYLQQGGQVLTVEKIFYYTKEGLGYTHIYPDSDVKGLIWLSPDRQVIIYIPPELENALFTKLYFFNGNDISGQSLEHFEFVNNWGGEVKLFKVLFNETA